MMRSRQCRSGGADGARVSTVRATSPVHSTALALALLLSFAMPLCRGVPVFMNPSTTVVDQLLSQIDKACSSYLSAEQPLRTSDALRDLCGLMLEVLQKYQELSAREPSKRFLFHYTKPNGAGGSDGTSSVFHPLLQLIPQLHSRRRRRVSSNGDLQGPGAIQSRGYFLYRPRNGRRSSEYVY